MLIIILLSATFGSIIGGAILSEVLAKKTEWNTSEWFINK